MRLINFTALVDSGDTVVVKTIVITVEPRKLAMTGPVWRTAASVT